jgi:hypothetical protein
VATICRGPRAPIKGQVKLNTRNEIKQAVKFLIFEGYIATFGVKNRTMEGKMVIVGKSFLFCDIGHWR